jgi:hypothetical protein
MIIVVLKVLMEDTLPEIAASSSPFKKVAKLLGVEGITDRLECNERR